MPATRTTHRLIDAAPANRKAACGLVGEAHDMTLVSRNVDCPACCAILLKAQRRNDRIGRSIRKAMA
jgi:hypothetical protein